MLLKPCPRCKRMMPYGPTYCKDCAPIMQAELEAKRERRAKQRARQYNLKRDPKYQAFYRSKAWKVLSRAYLQAKRYKCEAHLTDECKGLAVEVHHKMPIQTPEGWEKRLDWDNFEALCTSCHNARHPEKFNKRLPDGVIDIKNLGT